MGGTPTSTNISMRSKTMRTLPVREARNHQCQASPHSLLNKRSEITGKCRHKAKFKELQEKLIKFYPESVCIRA